MKKIFSLLLIALCFSFMFTACSSDDDNYGDGDTISKVFEVKGSFRFDNQLGWVIRGFFNPQIPQGSHLLLYRLSDVTVSGQDVWQLIPRNFYFDLNDDGFAESELNYDYDFSMEDYNIYASGNYDLTLTPTLINNQIFRIVIIPGSASGSAYRDTKPVDYNDYHAVLNYYSIDDHHVKVLKP